MGNQPSAVPIQPLPTWVKAPGSCPEEQSELWGTALAAGAFLSAGTLLLWSLSPCFFWCLKLMFSDTKHS